jgi:hypothetical protein
MTGRGAGYCAGYPVPGYMNPGPARGSWGWGRGRGRGRRNRYYGTGVPGWQRAAWGWPAFAAGWGGIAPDFPPPVPATMSRDQELDVLKRQAESFAGALEEIKQRIAELERQPQPD